MSTPEPWTPYCDICGELATYAIGKNPDLKLRHWMCLEHWDEWVKRQKQWKQGRADGK